jgi:ABC-2 type transport system ATP-binding protein
MVADPRQDSSGPILELDAVEKRYGEIRAVDGVSLEVRRDEILALVGPNGAGKTTLLRMIVGILGPDAGRITFSMDGAPPGPVPDRRRLGYLPEERGLYTNVPVLRVLRYFAALRGMPKADAVAAAERWLERLDLADRANDEVKALSKGNQQKVQFISAVLHRPALAILDEPFSGLDPLNQEFFLDLVRELREAGTTILFSAHQMQLVERLADRVILLGSGRVAGQGTLDELREGWGPEVTLHDIYVRTVGPAAREDRP